MSCQINVQKSVITGLIGKKSCKKQKKDILKKKLLNIMQKTKNLSKKSQDSVMKICHKKEKTRLRSTKEKSIKN